MLRKEDARIRRKVRIRKKISGTYERPRLVVFRSNLHIYAQIIDDTSGTTLVSASTLSLQKNKEKAGCNKEGAMLVGKEIARLAKEKSIAQVVFDRNGYIYHGRIKAVADGAREAGLEF
ncbi:50S ribosomal protein L18 [Desulfovibrio litoralis]|uniref:Large ribosomal subunit protein uL18 n=1 Tax=Desulfovibrio litoralis DSM 11393 TaxID=1121455 RepID=A0A1M7SDX6_9BACT|nr:50S ribosomal protein L18 [Desulfovibrio litoralis]SHN56663.1 LSU ribosomal protein L18P [Desulfovibrio litoralis DSM 11393]